MTLASLIYVVLNPLVVLALAPFFMGLIRKVKAQAQGRSGPPLLQGYYQLAKLWRKEMVYSQHASFIMRLAPHLNLACLTVAALAVPVTFLPQVGQLGNIILFVYLLATAKFFLALGGLDAGSTFGGMGASREMSLSAIIEPTTIIVCAALAFVLGTTDIPTMFARVLAGGILQYPTLILLALSLFIILIVETARVPVDNPETHLELTMIHEAMILEQSGPNLALLELAHGMKQTVLMALLINIIFPLGLAVRASVLGMGVAVLAFAAKATVLAVAIGLFESALAKIRLFRLPSFFTLALFFSFVTIVIKLLT